MNTYYLNGNIITCDLFDFIEADTATSLLDYVPSGKILGIAKDSSTLYFYDGSVWIPITSNISTSASVPNPVTNLILQEGNGSVYITWNAVSDAIGYKIYHGTSGTITYDSSTEYTNYTLSGLTNGATYQAYIYAYNEVGNSFPTSGQFSPSISVPSQVQNVQINSYSTSSISLTWNSVSNSTSYKIYMTPQGSDEVVVATPTTNSAIITNLTQNTLYSFTVAAVGIGGEGQESSTVTQRTQIDLPDTSVIYATSGNNKITLNWTASDRATSYDVYKGISTSSFSFQSNTSALTYIDLSATNGIVYYYYINSKNETGITQSNIVSAMPQDLIFSVSESSIIPLSFSGMISDLEYEDFPMTSSGKTISISLNPLKTLTSGFYDYVDMTFVNLRNTSALGLEVYIKENNPYVSFGAEISADVTNNLKTGWVSAVVNIPPAYSSTIPSYKTIRLNFGTNEYTGSNDIIFRYFLPYNEISASYGRTFTSSGAADYEQQSIFTSYSITSFEYVGYPTDWRYGIASISGNVTKDKIYTTDWRKSGDDSYSGYKPPQPNAIPWSIIKFHSTGPSKKIIEMVGDSIMQGYGDKSQVLNVGGIPFRARQNFKNTEFDFINFGQSGFTPEQYLARWFGYAKETSGTALVYSIFSPNGYFNNGEIIQSRIDEMKTNCIYAEQLAKECNRVFIPCWITNTNMFQLNATPAISAALNVTNYAKDLLDWAVTKYGSRLINLQPSVNDDTNTIGINMKSEYTNDSTHPNESGYDALGSLFNTLFVDAYNNSVGVYS